MLIRMPPLLTVHYPNPQQAADRLAPLGWCGQCIGLAKQAEANGEPAPVIHAGVVMVATPQQVPVPGLGNQLAVVPMATCWEHCGSAKASALMQAAAGMVPGT
jgi:hypothetical protein